VPDRTFVGGDTASRERIWEILTNRDDALKGIESLPRNPMSLTVSLLNRQTLRTAENLLGLAGATLAGRVRERRGRGVRHRPND
jgi:hypothetical protein